MLRRHWRRALAPLRGVRRHPVRIVAAAFLGLMAGACTLTGQPIGPLAGTRMTTIAIESIEGLPPALTSKLATNLSEIAEARQIAIVARDEHPQYRLRGYLTSHVERGKTSIDWVWDIYGLDSKRAARINGAEPGGDDAAGKSGDAWAMVDDRVLRRIAQSGVDRVLTLANTPDSIRPTFTTDEFPRGMIQARAAPLSEFR